LPVVSAALLDAVNKVVVRLRTARPAHRARGLSAIARDIIQMVDAAPARAHVTSSA